MKQRVSDGGHMRWFAVDREAAFFADYSTAQ
jgi:hypothetical protein